jgi:hypothetical protein
MICTSSTNCFKTTCICSCRSMQDPWERCLQVSSHVFARRSTLHRWKKIQFPSYCESERTKYLCGYDKTVEILQRQISQRVLHVEEEATHLTTVRSIYKWMIPEFQCSLGSLTNLVCNSDEEGMKETHRVALCEGKKKCLPLGLRWSECLVESSLGVTQGKAWSFAQLNWEDQ